MKKLIFSIVALCACAGATAQSSFYVYKTDGSTVEYAVSEVDSISFTKPEWLAGAFSVADGKQIYFSQGNLQCSGVTTGAYVWSFAENQYDMIGTANVSGGVLADKIDLFGWSGSTGSAQWGISTSTDYSDYFGDFVDWGTNTIGAASSNTYRTLTKDEWDYLLNSRDNSSDLKGVARIKISETDYANGLVLLPDSWVCPKGVTFTSGFANSSGEDYYATYQTFTLTEWQKLEAAGAVFLPASGRRDGSSMSYVQSYGSYWSATPDGAYYANDLRFYSNSAGTSDSSGRGYGLAVRLVKDVK